MMRVTLILLAFFVLLSCRFGKRVEIIPLHPYVKREGTDLSATTYYYFVVKNFDFENIHSYDTLYSYASKLNLLDSNQKDGYMVLFYSHSDQTNEIFREDASDLVDWHSEDLLFIVAWQNGRPSFKQRFREGRLIDSSHIEIKIDGLDFRQNR